MFESFTSVEVDTGATQIFARWAGSGPPVLLLHGFPETHLMWRDIAPRLAEAHTVVCAAMGEAAVRPAHPTMRRIRNGLWRRTC
jgi:pimeloyl-ACP methyl ester carboxylesterase